MYPVTSHCAVTESIPYSPRMDMRAMLTKFSLNPATNAAAYNVVSKRTFCFPCTVTIPFCSWMLVACTIHGVRRLFAATLLHRHHNKKTATPDTTGLTSGATALCNLVL